VGIPKKYAHGDGCGIGVQKKVQGDEWERERSNPEKRKKKLRGNGGEKGIGWGRITRRWKKSGRGLRGTLKGGIQVYVEKRRRREKRLKDQKAELPGMRKN